MAQPTHPPLVVVAVDPRVELLAGLQILAEEDLRLDDILDREDTPYRRELVAALDSPAFAPAVEAYRRLGEAEFSYDAPHELMLGLEWPGLRRGEAHSAYLVERAGGMGLLEELDAALLGWGERAGFHAFLERWRPTHEALVARLERRFDVRSAIDQLEGFFGRGCRRYEIVPSPLMLGGYCARLEKRDGVADRLVALFGRGLDGDDDGDHEALEYVLHEFAHEFINSVTSEHLAAVDELAFLFEPLEETMTSYAYNDWEICFNEHLVRAATVLMQRRMGEGRLAERMLAMHRELGFAHVDACLARLEEYAGRPDRPPYRDAFPELLRALKHELGCGESGS